RAPMASVPLGAARAAARGLARVRSVGLATPAAVRVPLATNLRASLPSRSYRHPNHYRLRLPKHRPHAQFFFAASFALVVLAGSCAGVLSRRAPTRDRW